MVLVPPDNGVLHHAGSRIGITRGTSSGLLRVQEASNMIFRRGPVIVLSLVLGAAALVVTPSVAAGDDGTAKEINVNECERSSTVRLKVLLNEDGRLEVTGIVWSDDEDVWDWKFKHNDDVSADGDVKARDADKSFKIVRTMYNFTGPDSVFFRADNATTGEACKVTVSY
jgi:hypothetical protein